MNKVYNPLKKSRGNNMPSYEEYKIDNKTLMIAPSGKRGFSPATPFFNGSEILFDLKVTMPYIKGITESLELGWRLWDKDTAIEINSGKISFTYTNVKKLRKKGTERHSYDHTADGYNAKMWFVKQRAIDVGRLREFHTYDLKLKADNSKQMEGIVCEFTLKDIDDFGLTHTLNLLSTGYAVLGAIIGGVMTAILLKGCGGG